MEQVEFEREIAAPPSLLLKMHIAMLCLSFLAYNKAPSYQGSLN